MVSENHAPNDHAPGSEVANGDVVPKGADASRLSYRARMCQGRIGMIPIPLFLSMALVVFLSAHFGYLPANMIGGLAVIMTLGMFFGQLGQRLPIVRDIGGGAVLCLMVPSVLVFYGVFGSTTLTAVKVLMKDANFLYFVIASLVVGSILGMSRVVLVQGMLKLFVPLVAGSLVAIAVGIGVGLLFGYSAQHTFFFIVVPILSGGIGEGILPLSLAYSHILGGTPESFVAQLVPAAVVGNIVAIVISGLLARLALKRPDLGGDGMLIRVASENDVFRGDEEGVCHDFPLMGAGVLLVCCFFVLGGLLEKQVGIPGPVLMIMVAVLFKYAQLLPDDMERGAHGFYKFVSSAFIWPVMIGLGMLYVPLDSVVNVFSIGYVAVCLAVVLSICMAGFLIGNMLRMYPIESAIVTACHSGLGGTGDVAILSAANRMVLMPFAQVSTRVGGATMVIVASVLLRLFT